MVYCSFFGSSAQKKCVGFPKNVRKQRCGRLRTKGYDWFFGGQSACQSFTCSRSQFAQGSMPSFFSAEIAKT